MNGHMCTIGFSSTGISSRSEASVSPSAPPREKRGPLTASTQDCREKPHMQREALGPSVLEGEGIRTYMPSWKLLSLPSQLLPAGSGLQWPCAPAGLYQGNQTLPSPRSIHLTRYFECPSE